MKTRATVGLGALAVALLVVVWLLWWPGRTDAPVVEVARSGASGRPNVPSGEPYVPDPAQPLREGSREPAPAPQAILRLPRMIALADALNDPDASVEDDLEVLGELFRQFRRNHLRVPAGGLNAEIVAGLRGKNDRRMVYIGEDHARLNENGELLDRFGAPYYFHPVSDQLIEVRSRGADGKLWTDDDLTLEPQGAEEGGTSDGQ